MSRRRGRPRTGHEAALDHFEAIAGLHAAGFGTAEIQAKLGGRRHTICRVRAILRAAEDRGRESVSEVFGSSERPTEPFPKYLEEDAP